MLTPHLISFAGTEPEDLGIGHRIEVSALTGASVVHLPLEFTRGRGDFTPRLTLEYTSSAGNSPFGLGWSLGGLLAVNIDTRKALPRYDGHDRFAFSGSGELVPVFRDGAAGWQQRVEERDEFWVRYFRGRVEGGHIRIEQWSEKVTGRVHWRTRDARNVVTVYGFDASDAARIADPADAARTFAWMPEAQYDASGNAIKFEYVPEDRKGLDTSVAYERRGAFAGLSQRYLKRVLYGNTKPLRADAPIPEDNRWCFEVVFDYGEHDEVSPPQPEGGGTWSLRPDPFSTYRPGFEVRTYRLCRRVLLFHRFEELGAAPVLVGAYRLEHDLRAEGSTLKAAHYTGFRREAGSGLISQRSLPPLRFEYSIPSVGHGFEPAPAESLQNVPHGLDGSGYRWIDLYGEGLPGILTETAQAWYFKSNEGDGRFGPQHLVAERPAYRLGQCALGDFDNDGNVNLFIAHGRQGGFYEYDRENDLWNSFRPFTSLPHLEAAGAKAQWLDLNGDGRADLILSDPERVTWYPSLGKEGFGAPVEIRRPHYGAASVTAPLAEDPALDYFFANMSGDGLLDQVRVRNGRVEYWPALGHGRFGDPVLMEGSPVFAPEWEFDARRILLVDLDGSGTADIVYVGNGEVRCWINAQGNRLVEGPRLGGLPYIDNVSTLRVLDFLGRGTQCLVWSSPLADRASPIQYLPLTGGLRPRLLLSVNNSMGREVRLTYSTSAAHYLRDKRAGRPWRTKLPMNTVVVDEKEEVDNISGGRSLTRYEYHDGYFDSEERTFRGFGLVDQFDAGLPTGEAPNTSAPAASPACLRTWFHLGRDAAGVPAEAYSGDAKQVTLAPHGFEPLHNFESSPGLRVGECEDGLRALSGQIIRQELFAVSAAGERAAHPFRVTQTSYRLRRLQPAFGEYDASFTFYPGESLAYDYDQQPDDPRINHTLIFDFDVDDYGTVKRESTVFYARRPEKTAAAAAQRRLSISVRTRDLINFDLSERYELGVPVEEQEFEVAGALPGEAGIFTRDVLDKTVDAALAAPLAQHEQFTGGAQARLMSWERVFYWDDSAAAALPSGSVGARTLLHHLESACFTADFIAQTLDGRADPDMLRSDGGYLERDSYWWRPGETHHLHPAGGFFQLARLSRPHGAETVFTYDAHSLALVEVRDALGNVTRAEIDYHLVAPRRIVDENDNVAEVSYDPLGVAAVSTMQGQLLDSGGAARPYGYELLSAYTPRAGPTFESVLTAPAFYLQGCAQYVYYELDAWASAAVPPRVVKLVREEFTHAGEGGGAAAGEVQVLVSHFDGFSRTLQTKTLVERGPALLRDADGRLVLGEDGQPSEGPPADRWLVSGHTVYDHKQQPFRQYEPYFSTTAVYEPEEALAAFGVFHQSRYDSAGRVVREDFPDGTYARTEFGAWEVRRYDPNDTVLDSLYRARRAGLADTDAEKRALRKAEAHADTPAVVHLDPQGHEVMRVETVPGGVQRATETTRDFHGEVVGIAGPRLPNAFSYSRDMAGRVIFSHSADAGDRRALPDIYDRPVHLWDSRGVHQRRHFDALDRPTSVFVDGALGLSNLTEQFIYGEDVSVAQASLRNARGRLVTHRDQAGTLTIQRYDPSGRILRSERQLRRDYKTESDWNDSDASALDPTTYATANSFDALGRIRQQRLPDGTTRRLEYLRGGGLDRVRLDSEDGALSDFAVFDGSDFNARGQRTRARLGNSVEITHAYGRETFRAERVTARLLPSHPGAAATLQDIEYTYDPAGNVTRSVDNAQQPARPGAFLQGLNVSAEREFTYDAFYQLIEATGRVHQSLLEHDYRPGLSVPGAIKGTRHLHLNNGAAVERYTRTYEYDLAGNFRRVRHRGVTNNWNTEFQTSPASNRTLPALDPSGQPVAEPESRFDQNGNCVSLPHVRRLEWDYRNNISRAVVIDRSAAGGADDAEYYVYDGDGMRVRKVFERLTDSGVEVTETIYLDGCEVRRVRVGAKVLLERFTSHVSDGVNRIALVHRWTRDELARETDDITRPRVRFQLTDHLGSSQLELDERGAVVSYEEYFPFDGTSFIAGDSLREVNVKDYRFCGKERDEATGLYYFGYRYYAAWLGRWMSPDPIGPEDDDNLYRYVFNNPINLTDPDGLQASRRPSRGPSLPRGYVTFERLQSLLPGEYRDTVRPNQSYQGVVVENGGAFRMNVTSGELRAIAGQHRGAWIAVYDPNFQRAYERLRARGSSEEAATRVAEALLPVIGDTSSSPPAGQEGRPGAWPSPPTGAGTGSGGSQQPSGAEHGDPGQGEAQGPGGVPASSSGTSSSRDPEATQTHDAGGGGVSPSARATQPGGTGSQGVGPGAGTTGGGSGTTGTGQGNATQTSPGRGANTRPGGSGAGPGGSGPARHSSHAPPSDEPNVPGSAPRTGEHGGSTGVNPGVTPGSDPSVPSDGGTPAPPGQTVNGNDPNGSLYGAPDGVRGGRERDGGSGGSGSGTHQPQQQTVMDQVVQVASYLGLEFGEHDRGESGGIPGATGTHNAGGWGQALMSALHVANFALLFAGGAEVKALLRGFTAGLKGATALLSKVATKQFWQQAMTLLAGKRAPILLDTNILSWIAAGKQPALAFVNRYGGRLRVESTVVAELLQAPGQTLAGIEAVMRQHGIGLVESASRAEARLLLRQAGVYASENDRIIVATAHKHGMKFVSGDYGAFNAARQLGVDARAWMLVEDNAVVTRFYDNAIKALARQRVVNPNSFIGPFNPWP